MTVLPHGTNRSLSLCIRMMSAPSGNPRLTTCCPTAEASGGMVSSRSSLGALGSTSNSRESLRFSWSGAARPSHRATVGMDVPWTSAETRTMKKTILKIISASGTPATSG